MTSKDRQFARTAKEIVKAVDLCRASPKACECYLAVEKLLRSFVKDLSSKKG
jgi:hypothetical protein